MSTDSILIVVGDNLRRLREGKHWTQAYVAERAGLSKQAISKYERGGPMPLVTLVSLANVFGIDPSRLLRRLGPIGAYYPMNGRGAGRGGGRTPMAVRAVVEEIDRPVAQIPQVDHSACNPEDHGSLCGECRTILSDVRRKAV